MCDVVYEVGACEGAGAQQAVQHAQRDEGGQRAHSEHGADVAGAVAQAHDAGDVVGHAVEQGFEGGEAHRPYPRQATDLFGGFLDGVIGDELGGHAVLLADFCDWVICAIPPDMRAVVAFLMLVSVGCAYSPAYRPVGPPMLDAVFEGGAGVHGIVGQDTAGIGATAWAQAQVAPNILIVARGHGTDLIPYVDDGGLFQDGQTGGSLGLRGVFPLREELLIGGEVNVDYVVLRQGDSVAHFFSGIMSFPVAEQAFTDVWLYVQPSIGAGPRFGDVSEPFAGFMEIPVGVAWKIAPWAVLSVEGGFAIPFSGGYLGVAGAFRL